MWSDHETEQDCLGFQDYVRTIADVCLDDSVSSLTFGIFGSWGSGKTSLMRMLKKHIEQPSTSSNVKTLWFNAWRYEGKDETQAALIHAILNKLAEDKTLLDEAKQLITRLRDNASGIKLAKFIGKTALTLTPDISGFLKCFSEESQKIAETMERFEADFEDLLAKMKVQRLVVFIDDLDRCQVDKVIEIFETIKLFLDIPKCTFVIGADAAKIERAIGDMYGKSIDVDKQFARDYLEKIIQVPFSIPVQRLEDIACYVGMLILQPYLTADGWHNILAFRRELQVAGDKLPNVLSKRMIEHTEWFRDARVDTPTSELQRTLPYVSILARGLRGNPRQVKRFLNILDLRRRLAKHNDIKIDPDILIKVTVLEYSWPDFFKDMIDTFDPVTGTVPLLSMISEVVEKRGKKAVDDESELLKKALDTPGLARFLQDKPQLDSKLDLSPYLYLAQTALGSTVVSALSPIDETARSLATRVASDDRVRSEAAARQTAKQELPIAEATAAILLSQLLGTDNERVRTHILMGIDIICFSHKQLYPQVLNILVRLEFRGAAASAFAAGSLVSNAEKTGLKIDDSLRKKLEGASTLGKAMSKLRKT